SSEDSGTKANHIIDRGRRRHAAGVGLVCALADAEAVAATPSMAKIWREHSRRAASRLSDLNSGTMSPELVEFFRLAPLGLVVGAFGTLVGAGGGAVMVPALLVLLPHQTAANVTAISLATVFFNAYSGTVAYMRMG